MNNHFIPLPVAIEMTARFRKHQNDILIPALRDKGILPICETFDRGALDTLLAKEGCVRIRTYLGIDADEKIRMITVAVNDKGEDMLSSLPGTGENEGDEDIVEDGIRCPVVCPPKSPLNED